MSSGRTDQGSRRLRLLAAAPWVVVLLGVVVMVVLFLVAVLTLTTEHRSPGRAQASAPVPAPYPTDGAGPTGPASTDPSALPVASTGRPVPSSPRTAASTGSPPRTATARTRAPAAPVTLTGRYRVVSEYPDSFTGEVLVSNVSTVDRSWTVLLSFPAGVGSLRSSWVEGARQATVTRDGDRYVFTSGVPLAAGQSVALRFQFNDTGGVDQPVECSVNGSPCLIG